MAIPLSLDILFGILYCIICQSRNNLIGYFNGRTISISVLRTTSSFKSLIWIHTVSFKVSHEVLKIVAFLIWSLLPIFKIVSKLGIHQSIVIHYARDRRSWLLLLFLDSIPLCGLLHLLIIVLWLLHRLCLLLITPKKHIGNHATHFLLSADITCIHLRHHAECLRNQARLLQLASLILIIQLSQVLEVARLVVRRVESIKYLIDRGNVSTGIIPNVTLLTIFSHILDRHIHLLLLIVKHGDIATLEVLGEVIHASLLNNLVWDVILVVVLIPYVISQLRFVVFVCHILCYFL